MKLMDWHANHSIIEWDQYKAFHILIGGSWDRYKRPIVQFDTGEMIVRRSYLRPATRKTYDDLNVTLFQADDIGYSSSRYRSHLQRLRTDLRDPDGNKVAWSQLTKGGSPLMLWDHDTNRIVTCAPMHSNKMIPERLRSVACAYFAGPGSAPVGVDTTITTPAKLNKDEKDHIAHIRAACKAWYEMGEEGKQYEQKMWVSRRPLHSDDVLKVSDFLSLPVASRIQLARSGTVKSNEHRKVTYLQVVQS